MSPGERRASLAVGRGREAPRAVRRGVPAEAPLVHQTGDVAGGVGGVVEEHRGQERGAVRAPGPAQRLVHSPSMDARESVELSLLALPRRHRPHLGSTALASARRPSVPMPFSLASRARSAGWSTNRRCSSGARWPSLTPRRPRRPCGFRPRRDPATRGWRPSIRRRVEPTRTSFRRRSTGRRWSTRLGTCRTRSRPRRRRCTPARPQPWAPRARWRWRWYRSSTFATSARMPPRSSGATGPG